MNHILNPQLGQFVKVAQGRDADKLAVIVGLEPERYVFIADGDKRKFEQPKRKNLLHLELQKDISREVVQSLNESGRVTNSKLRYVIQKYAEQLNEANAE
ncbi:KOW domain-containing RNA-binding protein [Paenibacillus arenosi]|uniref:KOW domain-containing RNA-binding protein n=2 Tax=Paenibacillus TaxID=44249 RepID=A0ABR9B2J4_9BACL|nr:KOW domain-containing RNA-binding protein [Paenibacillus arenosi]MBD8500593.1 KOW domain-containing RNA-binding protein [Paenibacillus arenosi]